MAYLLVVVAGICWGTIGLFTKATIALGFTEMELMLVKSFVSAAFMTVILLIKDRESFRLKKVTDIKYFIGTGVASYLFFGWSYLRAINLTGMSVAAVLLYTSPAIVTLLSALLFKDRMTKRKWIVVAAVILGCAMVAGIFEGGLIISPLGLFAGLCAGFGYALYSIFGTFAINRGYNSLTISFYTFLMSSVFVLFLASPVAVAEKTAASGSWVLVISSALVTTGIPFLCYTKGLSGIPASKAAVTATIEPAVAAILGILVLHEEITVFKICGILLVLGAVVFMNSGKKMRIAEEKTEGKIQG